jgi:ABC-type lipopolysaccharide export system ATPase subunit
VESGIPFSVKQDLTMEIARMKMSKVIRASIVFEYLVDEDEVMSELTPEDQIEYVKETTVEDIMTMGFGTSDDLLQAINIEVIDV